MQVMSCRLTSLRWGGGHLGASARRSSLGCRICHCGRLSSLIYHGDRQSWRRLLPAADMARRAACATSGSRRLRRPPPAVAVRKTIAGH